MSRSQISARRGWPIFSATIERLDEAMWPSPKGVECLAGIAPPLGAGDDRAEAFVVEHSLVWRFREHIPWSSAETLDLNREALEDLPLRHELVVHALLEGLFCFCEEDRSLLTADVWQEVEDSPFAAVVVV